MKEEHITKVTLDPENPPKGQTDWEHVDALTEEETNEAASSDPENPPLTEAQLKQFRRVPDVKSIREHLQLSQQQFAKTYRLSLRTLQEWEQGRRGLDTTAVAYLTVIANAPDAVRRALVQRS